MTEKRQNRIRFYENAHKLLMRAIDGEVTADEELWSVSAFPTAEELENVDQLVDLTEAIARVRKKAEPGVLKRTSLFKAKPLLPESRLIRGVRPKAADRTRIVRPPGSRAAWVLGFIFPRTTFRVLFAQTIADEQDEYLDAMAAGRNWHARWISIRVYITLGATMLAWFPAVVGKRLVAMWKAF